ncbi:uncharacterized protein LOC122959807 [Acropora millepora]|uniref:uncharacterized protein LOC122959807 n=1 Tax=Acropora millepora TaxID=45264 RepID=UPI001CF34EFC|nr:uncharacterized protein LOC122959807 [Acropora millepora]
MLLLLVLSLLSWVINSFFPLYLACNESNEYCDETTMETREPVTALEQIDIESTTLPTPTPASSNIYLLPETSSQCIQLDDQCNSTIDGCVNCCNLQKEIESMKGEVRSLKLKATLLKNKMAMAMFSLSHAQN